MSRPFEVHLPLEQAYVRNVLFAIEVLDAVTLARVSQGLKVVADGLQGSPIVNASGLFVWLMENIAPLRKVTIDPGMLPYESAERAVGDLQLPLTTITLPPRRDYPFAPGIAGLRGMLVESRVIAPTRPRPVADAIAWLQWLDDDDAWRDAPIRSRTDDTGGFASFLRFATTDVPRLDGAGDLIVRLLAQRAVSGDRRSLPFSLPKGQVADAFPPFAWDEFLP